MRGISTIVSSTVSSRARTSEIWGSGFGSRSLPYRKPKLGRDYWIKDDMLTNALEVAARCRAKTAWVQGLPSRKESWPGMRSHDALLRDELRQIEDWVKGQTGAERLWQTASPDRGTLSHNYAQLVGGADSGPRPHTDSRKLCRYAAVLYLSPDAPACAGTSFYRLRLPNGRLSGNTCLAPHSTLGEALSVTALPLGAWQEDVAVPNVFNRLLVYRSDIVHSATSYFGDTDESKRLTAVFFWMG